MKTASYNSLTRFMDVSKYLNSPPEGGAEFGILRAVPCQTNLRF